MSRVLALVLLTFVYLPRAFATETLIFYEGDPPLSHPAGYAPSGVYFDIVTAIFDDLGIDYTVTSLPFKRGLMQAKAGKGIVVGIFKTDERAQYLDFSDNFYSTQVVLFTKKGHAFLYHSITDLKDRHIGAKLGWSYGETFDSARNQKLFSVVEGESESLIKQLLQERTDAFIDNKLTGIYSIKKLGIEDQIEIIPKPIDTGPHYLGVRKGSKTELLKQFNQRLLEFQQDGRYKQLLIPYF
jgi:polar amino acid transport system substrate-binding protein